MKLYLTILLFIATVSANNIGDRTFHLGGSITNNEELIIIKRVPIDITCYEGFTEKLFGLSGTTLTIDMLNNRKHQVQVSTGVSREIINSAHYRVQFARWNSTVIKTFDATGVIPTLKEQVDQIFDLFYNNTDKDDARSPTLITMTSGANDVAVIFLQAAALAQGGANASVIQAFVAGQIQLVLMDPTQGIATQVTRLFAHAHKATIVLGNVPDLSMTPFFIAQNLSANATGLLQAIVFGFNAQLANLVTIMNVQCPARLLLWDLNAVFDGLLANSVAPYNTTACAAICSLDAQCIFADGFSAAYGANIAAAEVLYDLVRRHQCC